MDKWQRSRELYQQSQLTLAAGVSSNLRLAMKPVPIFLQSASGSRLMDVDGNEYVDYILAYGPQILGHSHPAIVQAITEQVKTGQTYGMQHVGEIELSQKITTHVPCAELVSFCSTGTEAVQVAIRVSRAYTGRSKILKFAGHYHGWMDNVFTSPVASPDQAIAPGTKGQSLKALEEVIVIPWNDIDILERTIAAHGEEIAAVITEPILCNSGCIVPLPGYMEKVRALTEEAGIVLIFDEVITGFRFGLGGAQTALGVTPDLVTLGKAVAGGLPLSAVAGKKEIMAVIASNDVNHMGTLNGNPLCTAAAIATIEYLERDNGSVYTTMTQLANHLAAELNALSKKYGFPMVVNKKGPVFHTMFTELDSVSHYHEFQQRDADLYSAFAETLLEEGVAVRPSGLWYISASHSEQDVALTVERAEKAFKKLKK